MKSALFHTYYDFAIIFKHETQNNFTSKTSTGFTHLEAFWYNKKRFSNKIGTGSSGDNDILEHDNAKHI